MAFSLKKVFSLGSQQMKPSPRVVGVDIGSSSIKVVEVEQREEAVVLTSYGELQLGPYANTDLGRSAELDSTKKIEALVDVIRESSIKAKSGSFAIPLSSSFVTVIPIELHGNEDVKSKVRVEARKYIPVAMSDVELDWVELPPLKETESNLHEVLIAAVQNGALKKTNELVTKAKLPGLPSEIELFSAVRGVIRADDVTVAIIDLGARTSKMYITHAGMVRLIYRSHTGGMQVTESLMTLTGSSFAEAEESKRNYQPDSPYAAEVKKVFSASYERVFQEFRRALEQFEVRFEQRVGRIVLIGGSASFSDMTAYAGYMFDREVVNANPFEKIAYPAFMEDTLREIAPTFSVAIGSALRPFSGG